MKVTIAGKEFDVLGLLSLGTALIFLLSYYNLLTYYGLFGIDITSYLEPTEIAFGFSSLYVVLVVFGFIMTSAALGLVAVKRFEERNPRKIRLIKTLAVLLSLAAVVPFGIFASWLRAIDPLVMVFLLLIVVFVVGDQIALKIRAGIIGVVLFVMLSGDSLLRYIAVQEGRSEFHVEVRTNDFLIKSSTDFIHIGTTKNFIFFWDMLSQKVMVYPLKDVKWISSRRRVLDYRKER